MPTNWGGCHPPNFPKVLYSFPECAGERFTPSNGTEGLTFTGNFCDQCQHERFTHTQKRGDAQCSILNNSLLGEDCPEWVYSGEGWPICTEWKFWDWGGRDGDDLTPPPEPEPDDPNQLLIPFDITDLFSFADPEILVTKKGIFERELLERPALRPARRVAVPG
jgi:hypothetical protein